MWDVAVARCQRTSLILFCALLALAIVDEACTSRLQSIVLSRYAARFTYDIGSGPSLRIVFPSSGPHDQQPGYSRLPEFTNRLVSRGYRIAEQAQMSKAAVQLAALGIAPPYREKASGGLVVRGASGAVVFDARPPKDCSYSVTRMCRRSWPRACCSSRTANCLGGWR